MGWLNITVWAVWFMSIISALFNTLFFLYKRQVWAHRIALTCMTVSLIAAMLLMKSFVFSGQMPVTHGYYDWINMAGFKVTVGFYCDALAAQMVWVVVFVSWVIHIYSMSYMQHDDGYYRFYALLGFFTFMMLVLVLAGNLIQLFFGWEGVGLASYGLIGFYAHKPMAARASFKAFLVNRLGDVGFFLGIALCFFVTGSLDNQTILSQLPEFVDEILPIGIGLDVQVVGAITALWFLGVMAKSAQMPLHVWLPDSMVGPTPISALIHAATMVTAGIYLMSRFSILYAASPIISNVILVVGASGALWLGLLGVFECDIKRIVAFSTLSQLGYMVCAVAVGAYSLGVYHLICHAYFKSLLFLAMGSVIHIQKQQNLEQLGGLGLLMPITAVTSLVGSLSLVGLPPLSGFFSKDAIITAVALRYPFYWGGGYVYTCLTFGVFVTGFYMFRLWWRVFVAKRLQRENQFGDGPLALWGPLVLLAVPSAIFGVISVASVAQGWFFQNVIGIEFLGFGGEYAQQTLLNLLSSPNHLIGHAWRTAPLYLILLAIVITYALYGRDKAMAIDLGSSGLMRVFRKGYGFDWFFETALPMVGRSLALTLLKRVEQSVIDKTASDRSAAVTSKLAVAISGIQTGRLTGYVTYMIMVVLFMLATVLWWSVSTGVVS
ncbi:MAG: NADH-quinone oxidoreductase subunit L [Pseudomonadota bacterium]|nr:NADH-quinone oxidoreductase subunit L [Pseudomonadota bacterium]